jgi:hypothetical protein
LIQLTKEKEALRETDVADRASLRSSTKQKWIGIEDGVDAYHAGSNLNSILWLAGHTHQINAVPISLSVRQIVTEVGSIHRDLEEFSASESKVQDVLCNTNYHTASPSRRQRTFSQTTSSSRKEGHP